MTVYEEIAAILHPLPKRDEVEPEEVYDEVCWEIDSDRQETSEALELGHQEGEAEPLLSAIAFARRRREEAEEEIRMLIAYGREFTRPRPYTLADLAQAAGMSISGVRTAYDDGQVGAVAEMIGRPSREWRAADA